MKLCVCLIRNVYNCGLDENQGEKMGNSFMHLLCMNIDA